MISRDVTVTSTRFLHAGQGNVTVASSGYLYLYFCNLTGNANVPELCVVARWRIIATLVNILREQGNEANFGGHGVRRLG